MVTGVEMAQLRSPGPKVEAAGDAVLIDLGLAIPIAGRTSAPAHVDPTSVTLPYPGLPFGVTGYRAPEVERLQPYGTPVDVFAFGRVLFNVLRCSTDAPSSVSWRTRKASLVYNAAYHLVSFATRWSISQVIITRVVGQCAHVSPSAGASTPLSPFWKILVVTWLMHTAASGPPQSSRTSGSTSRPPTRPTRPRTLGPAQARSLLLAD